MLVRRQQFKNFLRKRSLRWWLVISSLIAVCGSAHAETHIISDIDAFNAVNVNDNISILPEFSASVDAFSLFDISPTRSFNLRGLGSERTLVLLNGRRVAWSGDNDIFPAELFPATFVDHIAVSTGVDAIKNESGAIAGIVDIRTLQNFSGVEVIGSTEFVPDGFDGNVYQTTLRAGQKIAGGKGTASILANYVGNSVNELDRISLSTHASYQINPDIHLFTEGHYSHRIGPEAQVLPLIPLDIIANRQKNFAITTGLNGHFEDGTSVEGYLSFSEVRGSFSNLPSVLDPVCLSGFTDSAPVVDGSPSAPLGPRDTDEVTTLLSAGLTLKQDLSVSKKLKPRIFGGGEIRRENHRVSTPLDPQLLNGCQVNTQITPLFPPVSNGEAGSTVSEIYAGIELPGVTNGIGLDGFSSVFVGRLTNFSEGGNETVFSFAVKGKWRALEGVQFFAEFDRSHRASTLNELLRAENTPESIFTPVTPTGIEEANTLSAGIQFDLPQFTTRIKYNNIDIEGARISPDLLTISQLVNECFLFGSGSACDSLQSGSFAENIGIGSEELNFDIDYSRELLGGDFKLSYAGVLRLGKFSRTPDATDSFNCIEENALACVPRHSHLVTLNYSLQNIRATARWRRDSGDNPSGTTGPTSPIPSRDIVDAELSASLNDRLSLNIGVKNVFNQSISLADFNIAELNMGVRELLQRRVFVGAEIRF